MMLLLFIASQFLSCIHSFTYPRYSYNHIIERFNHIHLYSQQDDRSDDTTNDGIRLNKVFKATHSRREADKLIESGRVSINGIPITNKGGMKVIPYQDTITLDGKVVHGWEQMNAIQSTKYQDTNCDNQVQRSSHLNTESFEYVKYFKPLGVTCTTDQRIQGNIIDAIQSDGYNPRHRVYPVGRLDKETSGLILLTSDGRIVNSVLRGEKKQPKVYKVMVNGRLEDSDIQQLRVSMGFCINVLEMPFLSIWFKITLLFSLVTTININTYSLIHSLGWYSNNNNSTTERKINRREYISCQNETM